MRSAAARRPSFQTMAALALGVALLAIAALTVLAFRAASRQQAAGAALVDGITGWIGQRYATTVVSEIYLADEALFSRVGLGRGSPRTDEPTLEAIFTAADEVAACRCAAPLAPVYAFRFDLWKGELEVDWHGHAGGSGAVTRAALVSALRPLVAVTGWDFGVLSQLDPGGRFLLVARHQRRGELFYGIAVDQRVVVDRIFRQALKRRPAFSDIARFTISPESVALRVSLREGRTLFENHPGARPARSIEISLPDIFGQMRVTTGILDPDASSLAGGSLSGSPVPLALVLAVLGAAALVAFWGATRRALDLAAARAALVAGVNHELRTPLTQILLYAELIERGQLPTGEGHGGAALVIVRESRRLLRLIGNALNLVAGDEAGDAARLRPLPLRTLLNQALEDYRPLAAERQVHLELAAETEVTVFGDEDALRQIAINLLDNAVRHGPPGQTVTAGLARHGTAVEIFVRDEGPGIPHAWRGRVWEPFLRGPEAKGSSSGIGLAVVRRLAGRQGGEAGLRDAPGGGLEVFVRLPVASG